MPLRAKLEILLKQLQDENDLYKAIKLRDRKYAGMLQMTLNDPKASPEEKMNAQRQLFALRGYGDIGKQPVPGKPEAAASNDDQKLKDLAGKAKLQNEKRSDEGLSAAAKQASVALPEEAKKLREENKQERDEGKERAKKLVPDQLKQFKDLIAQIDDPQRKAALQAMHDKYESEMQGSKKLAGSDYTLAELQAHADRQDRDPNKVSQKIAPRALAPDQQAKVKEGQKQRSNDEILRNIHALHGSGQVDDAVGMFDEIPERHIPENLKGYRPEFMHYNFTPNDWSQMDQEGRNSINEYHNKIRSGELDNSDHPAHKQHIETMNRVLGPSKPPVPAQPVQDVAATPETPKKLPVA